MPLEVRELIIRATIVPDGRSGETAAGTSSSDGSSNNGVTGNEEMITLCVERILEILKDKDGR